MTPQQLIAAALDPSLILRAQGIGADAWQRDILFCSDRQILMNCCRQSGKSTTASALVLHMALHMPASLSLILSPGQRQSAEVFHKIVLAYNALKHPVKARHKTQFNLELTNGSRVLCLPGKEETVRCFTPDLLIIDEASRVPDDLYRAVRPMLAVKKGRLIALSTPFGQRGWFFDEWEGKGPWKKVKVTWKECSRISPDFIAEELRAMGRGWVDQEYNCLFTALEGLVYPDFETCFVDVYTPPALGKSVGGIDWGWRNPFAAIWGVLDRDDVLWIQDERYLRETPLHEHAKALPKIMWYADPAGRTETEEFRAADHKVRAGMNDIRLGIAALTARIRTGRLKVNRQRCPHLVAEAKLYRYPDTKERTILGENPVDEHNHALGALRYLISRIDTRFIAKLRKAPTAADGPIETDNLDGEPSRVSGRVEPPPQMNIRDPNLWQTFN